jgi:ATP-dependent helicase HrpA
LPPPSPNRPLPLNPSFSAAHALPVFSRKAEIAAAIAAHQTVVLCGQTGSGKTTQLPQIALALGRRRIAHTQPRRIAARAVAARLAEELSTPLGPTGGVGSRVRFDDQSGPANAVVVMTDGTLLAQTQSDPTLADFDTIIVDEAHERSLNIDFLLGYLRRLADRRNDLKLIITSATIDPQRFSDHFGGPSRAPIIEVSGRTFPVELRYRPFAEDLADFDDDRARNAAIESALLELTDPALPQGGTLVFLPGEREIRSAADHLRRRGGFGEVLPLFGRLSAAEQQRIFRPPAKGEPRVVLATNVAETSLTVPGILSVVDTGLARHSTYDHASKVQRLPIDRVSRASADQRAGRCGRTAPGVCIRLYSKADYDARPLFTTPEVLRASLASVILQALSLNLGPVADFPFIDPPSPAMVREGYDTLYELSAIDAPTADARLTDTGRALARLPLEPRIGRVLIAAQRERCLADALVIAAALSIQDPRERPLALQQRADDAHSRFRHDSSDFITLLNIFSAVEQAASSGTGALSDLCRTAFLSFTRCREWLDTHRQLETIAADLNLRDDPAPTSPPASPSPPHPRADALHRALLTGLVTNICCKDDATNHDYKGPKNARVAIFPGSALFRKNPRWFVAAELVETSRLFARTLARIDPAWITELAPHAVERSFADHHWDAEHNRPATWQRATVNGVVVAARARVPLAPHDPRAARSILIEKGLAAGLLSASHPFLRANRAALDAAATAAAKLRTHDAAASPEALARFFDARLPEHVTDPDALARWLAESPDHNAALTLSAKDALNQDAALLLTPERFPDHLHLPNHPDPFPFTYSFAPGHDDDGLTLTLSLIALADLPLHRPDWLVPGLLHARILHLLKAAPKALWSTLPRDHQPPPDTAGRAARAEWFDRLASDAAALLSFAAGPLSTALAEAVEVLLSTPIPPTAFDPASLPDHLLMRIVVTDDRAAVVAKGRHLPTLLDKLAPRLAAVRSAAAKHTFGKQGLTTFDLDHLPDEHDGRFPTLEDRTTSVALTLADSRDEAELLTRRGLLRLFALACHDELAARIAALPQWPAMQRDHKPLGSPEALRAALTDLIVERTFLLGHPLPRTREAFESLQAAQWGRLGQNTIEAATAVARTLEHRAKVAHRLAGGTPRTWAVSLADIREHAAFLMPTGFLGLIGTERLRDYPRYAEGLRHRLFVNLREDGSTGETKPLAEIAPHWKRFTAAVAAHLAAARRDAEAAPPASTTPTSPVRATLPNSRRAAPTINTDAGLFALRPGTLPPPLLAYRWALEEFRLALFAPDLAKSPPSSKRLDDLWAAAAPTNPA